MGRFGSDSEKNTIPVLLAGGGMEENDQTDHETPHPDIPSLVNRMAP